MSVKKRKLLSIICVIIGLSLLNSFFVSPYTPPFQATGFASSTAGVSLNISMSQRIRVIRDDFNGDTTNFNIGGNGALETLTGMTLERFGYAKIVFNQVVNITKDAYSPTGTVYDRIVDIDSNLEISRNYIYVNANNLSSLNKSVTITFSRVGYTSPKILRNDVNCPSNVCTLVSYSGGVAVFTISYFESGAITEYTLAETVPSCGDGTCNGAETCSTCVADCGACSEEEGGGGEGGGGGGTIGGRNITISNATANYTFYVTPKVISIDIEKGKSYLREVTIHNVGIKDLVISVAPSLSVSTFVQIEEKNFILKRGESKIYKFHIYSSTRSKADLYTGKLIFSSENVKTYVDLAIGVNELPALFDMKITSTKDYVLPGRIASANIKISNIGDSSSVKAVLEYGIMDFNNVIYSSRTENIVVAKNILAKKVSLKLPDDIGIGRYIYYAKATYEDKIAVSTDTFQVEQVSIMMWVMSLIMILVLITLVVFGILLAKKRNEEISQTKLKSSPTLKEEDKGGDSLMKELLNELKKTK